ncbi:hypothetical protein BC828DRAFT_386141 [Blastocladiella britannica]|nr:hypothetical protein BC828DRAFT_386141 [Blastocladiella britannica]
MGNNRKKRTAATPDPTSYVTHTLFRAAERLYKQKHIPVDRLDLSAVFDATVLASSELQPTAVPVQPADPNHALPRLLAVVELELLGTTVAPPPTPILVFPGCPGLIYLPAALSPALQRYLVRASLTQYTVPPKKSNLTAHWDIPPEGLWSAAASSSDDVTDVPLRRGTLVDDDNTDGYATSSAVHLRPEPAHALLDRLRWCTLGWQYNWTTKGYDAQDVAPFPPDLAAVSRAIALAVAHLVPANDDNNENMGTGYPHLVPQAGVLNVYGRSDALMAHVDQSEPNERAPLVSLSLGTDAVFLVGGPTRDTPPIALRLRSGDALVMSGPARRAFHGIPRILDGHAPEWMSLDGDPNDPEWTRVVAYLRARGARINLNVRQVEEI